MARSISCPECGHDEPRVRLEWSHKVVRVEEPSGVRPAVKVVTLSAMQRLQGTKFVRSLFICPKCAHTYKKPRGVDLKFDTPMDEGPATPSNGTPTKAVKRPGRSLYLVRGGRG